MTDSPLFNALSLDQFIKNIRFYDGALQHELRNRHILSFFELVITIGSNCRTYCCLDL